MSKISIINLNHSYKNKNVLSDVNLELPNNGLIALIGYSGSGKTTLISIISGFVKPSSGSVFVDLVDITKLNKEELRKYRLNTISYVHQENTLIGDKTSIENIEIALAIKGKKISMDKLEDFAERLMINDLLDKPTVELSGGERKRVEILREIMRDNEIFILDEPTSALDETSSKIVLKVLKELSKDKLVMISSHQVDEITNLADGLIDINDHKYELKKNKQNNNHFETIKVYKDYRDVKKSNRYRINILKISMMIIFFVLFTIPIAYRYQNKGWVPANLIYENDKNKKMYLVDIEMENTENKLNDIRYKFSNINIKDLYYPLIEFSEMFSTTNYIKMRSNLIKYDTDFEILFGRAPENNNEILITDLHFQLFKLYKLKTTDNVEKVVNNYADLIGEKVKISNTEIAQIVGIVNTNLDPKIDLKDSYQNIQLTYLLQGYHSAVFVFGDNEAITKVDYMAYIDVSKLSRDEVVELMNTLSANNLSIINEYLNIWEETINKDIDNYEKTNPKLSIKIILLMMMLIILLNTYLFSIEFNKVKRVDAIYLSLGEKDNELVKNKMIESLINYAGVLLGTYLINQVIILGMNISLKNQYKLIFNMLRGNVYIYTVPFSLAIILIICTIFQSIISIKTLTIQENLV